MAAPNVVQLPSWKNQLVRRKNGEPYADERNVLVALEGASELQGILRYDDFHDHILLTRPLPNMPRDSLNRLFNDDDPVVWCDEHLTMLTIWLLAQGFVSLRRTVVQDVVIAVAKRNGFHPAREYLEGLKWDGLPRIKTWLQCYLGAKDNPAYLEAIGPKFLIGAVARIMSPGCQMDTTLVLEGSQGLGKSTAVRTLAKGWSADMTGDLGNKDAAIHIQGVWLTEMSELSAIRRSDQETIKGFISRRIDRYRPPYGRNSIERPRQAVFIATTNENDYLQDPTGARRFWPVECSTINTQALEADTDQLWAEAMEQYSERTLWHLDVAEARTATAEQQSRQRRSVVDDVVLEYADDLKDQGKYVIDMRQLLADVFNINTREDPGKAGHSAYTASKALVKDGWKRLKPVGRGAKRRQCYQWIVEDVAVSEDITHKSHKPDRQEVYEPNDHESQASQAESASLDEDIPF